LSLPTKPRERAVPNEQPEFETLMERIRSGSQDAVRELLQKYGMHIVRVIRRRLHKTMRSMYDSRDFTQAVWASFFTNSIQQHSFRNPDELIAFLVAIASNKVVDAVRKRLESGRFNISREHSLEGSAAGEVLLMQDTNPSPSQVAMAKEKWEQIQQKATRPGQLILELVQQGITHAEIARRLGVCEKTVQRLLRNAYPRRTS
jgi:RNA polymerase sigma factor (sigma-70 family)